MRSYGYTALIRAQADGFCTAEWIARRWDEHYSAIETLQSMARLLCSSQLEYPDRQQCSYVMHDGSVLTIDRAAKYWEAFHGNLQASGFSTSGK